MIFLVDAQLPLALCWWLQLRGMGTVHVGEVAHQRSNRNCPPANFSSNMLFFVAAVLNNLYKDIPGRFATKSAILAWAFSINGSTLSKS